MPRKDFDATVHSVFHEAVNLRPITSNRLLTLVTAGCADLPQGVRMATPEGFSFELYFKAGDWLTCRGAVLADDQEQIEIDLAPAKRWKCSLPSLAADDITPQVVAAWTLVWQALNERQRSYNAEIQAAELWHAGDSAQSTIRNRVGELIRELIEAVRNLDASVGKIVARLIGLGSGLTPSGDDFLVGFLTGLQCVAGSNAMRLIYLRELWKLVIRLSHQTNDISRTYLYHAAHGQVSSRLAGLATAITKCAGREQLVITTEEALHEGHTSGMDTVTGLLVGLATWGNGSFPV